MFSVVSCRCSVLFGLGCSILSLEQPPYAIRTSPDFIRTRRLRADFASGTMVAPQLRKDLLVEGTTTAPVGHSHQFLKLEEAAFMLRVSQRTLHRLIQHQKMPGVKIASQWRIRESEFKECVQ